MNYGLVQPGSDQLPGGIGQSGDSSPHPPGMVVYFTVADLDAIVERAENLGAMTHVAPWTLLGLGRMVVLGDPDGNRVGLWQAE